MKRYLFLLILLINLFPRVFNGELHWECGNIYAMYKEMSGEIDEIIVTPDKPIVPDDSKDPPSDKKDPPAPPLTDAEKEWLDQHQNSGGGGSGGLPSDLPTTNEQKTAFIKKMVETFSKLGIDISKVKITFYDDGGICTARAQYLQTGEIKICVRFFSLSESDRLSCFNHEYYHKTHDKTTVESINVNFTITIPKKYYSPLETFNREELGNNIPEYYVQLEFESLLKDQESIRKLAHPDYYQNEINAYRSQLSDSRFPMSETYRKECEYMLWRNEMLLELSQKQFNK